MKKILLLFMSMAVVTMTMAQSKVIVERMEDTQARLLDVTSKGYVHPLTVEVKVDESIGRIKKTLSLSKRQAEIDLGGKLENIRSWAVYKTADELNVDIIVAPTISVRTNDEANGYEVVVIGYAGNYVNWATATEDDYEWIRIEKGSGSSYGISPVTKSGSQSTTTPSAASAFTKAAMAR